MSVQTFVDIEIRFKNETISISDILIFLTQLYGQLYNLKIDSNEAIYRHNRILKSIKKLEKLLDL